jgi:putative sigma-54 modulation protein
MSLEITFRHMEPSDAVRERAEKKFKKVAKHLRPPIEGHLVVKVEKHRHSAELTVSGGGEHFSAHDVTEDLYATIDTVMEKVERAVQRAKERHIDQAHHVPDPLLVDGFTSSK